MALGAYLLAVASLYLVAGLPSGYRGTGYLVVHGMLTGLFVLLWKSTRDSSAPFFRAVLGVGILARVLLVPLEPFTSHDSHRYLWDGHVAAAGLDPYRVSPQTLSDGWDRRLPDNARYPTIYPPLTLLIFPALAALGPSAALIAWKIVVVLASVLTLLLLWSQLKRRGRPDLVVLAALFPLSVLEAGVGAHLDVLATLGLVGAAIGFDRRGIAGASVGLGALLKLSPLVALPALALRARGREHVLVAVGVVATGYGLARLCGWSGIGSLGAFLGGWEFGSPVFGVLRLRGVLAVLGVAGWLVSAWKLRAEPDPWRSVMWGYAAVLAFSPVVFPWYFLPIAALSTLSPSPWLLAWMSVHPLTYEVIDHYELTGDWTPSTWPLFAIALVWAIAAFYHPRLREIASSFRSSERQ